MRRFERSLMAPIICGEKVSPKTVNAEKVEEIAVARTGAETEFTMAAFRGPVLGRGRIRPQRATGMAQGMRAKEDQHPEGQREKRRSRRKAGKARDGSVRSQRCAIQPPTSGAGDAVDHGDGAHGQTGVAHGQPGRPAQELRHPPRDAAHGKGQRGQPEGGRKKRRIGEHPQTVVRSAVGRHVVAGAALRLAAYPAVERGNQEAREWRRQRNGARQPQCEPICPPAR